MFVIPEISGAFYAMFSIILSPDDTIFIVIIYSNSQIYRWRCNFSVIRISDDGSYPVSGINRSEVDNRRFQIVKSKTPIVTFFPNKDFEEMEIIRKKLGDNNRKKERKEIRARNNHRTSCKRSRKFARISIRIWICNESTSPREGRKCKLSESR